MIPQTANQFSRVLPLISSVHDHRALAKGIANIREKLSAFRRIMTVTSGQSKGYSSFGIRGNHMKFGCPPSPRLADSLRPFFEAPVPSGWTFTKVESRETASIFKRIIRSFWSFSNTRSKVPFLTHRLIRV